jgi:hypothetical protein
VTDVRFEVTETIADVAHQCVQTRATVAHRPDEVLTFGQRRRYLDTICPDRVFLYLDVDYL